MPRIIVQNRIPRVKIGNRPIAVAPSDTGGGVIIGQMQVWQVRPTNVANNFIIPATGRWKFIAHGQGDVASPASYGAAGGAYAEITRFLAAGSLVVVRVGRPGQWVTSVTFPGGHVMSVSSGSTVSGGDVMYSGGIGGDTVTPVDSTPGGGPGGGPAGPAGAASGGGGAGSLQSPGGAGALGQVNGFEVTGPGSGGAVHAGGSVPVGAGSGLVIAYFVG